MAKARDLFNKLGGSSGFLTPPPMPTMPTPAKDEHTQEHGDTKGKPPSQNPRIKNQKATGGVGSTPTSVRPKV